jgi:UDP-N-acetylglucosamine 4,6-dehydratase/5-epimerase
VRYGNVVGSRGSVVPYFKELAAGGELPITDERMTRFWITLDQGVRFVMESVARMHGGELFVPKIPSMRVVDLAAAVVPDARLKVIGIRPGEKLHEEMISAPDSRRTVNMGDYYVIQPEMEWWPTEQLGGGTPVSEGFSYASDTNTEWLTVEQLREMIASA